MSLELSYLHLSDLHFEAGAPGGDGWQADAFQQDLVNRSLLEAIREQVAGAGKPDLVIVSGDLAYSAQPEEYQVAEVFCKGLLEATGLPPQRLYLVPGNHDVDRHEVRRAHVRSFYSFDDQEEIAETLADRDLFPILMRKLGPFNDFAERVMGRRHYDGSTYHLVESLPLRKDGREIRIALMGLNSALFAGYDGDDDHKLALGLPQVDRALRQLDPEARIAIGFFHHPFECLHPAEAVCRNRLIGGLDLILSGHLHRPANAVQRDPAGQALFVAAGAAYESRTHHNAFNRVSIDLETGQGRVEVFKYLPQHHRWKADTDLNPDHERGWFEFEIPRLRHRPLRAPEPEPPPAPARGPEYDIFISYQHGDAD